MINTSLARLICLLVASPVGICVAHAIVCRVAKGVKRDPIAPQILALFTIIIGNFLLLWIAWDVALREICRGAGEILCGVTYTLLTYNALAFWYFTLLNLSETSLHVHILMTLLVDGGISSTELVKRYSAAHMIETRVERMIALGQLVQRDRYYVLAGDPTLVKVGRILNHLRSMLRLPLHPEQKQ